MSENLNGCEGYTQTPNCFYDRLLGEINSLSEMKVTLALIRKIYGWHKENDPDGDLISFSQFIEITKLSRPMVKQGLDAGVKRGSIIQIAHGQSFMYRLNLSDYKGAAPESKRGEKLAELREAKRLNQFRDSTSLENKPLSGLENKPATGLDTKHTKETELKKLKESGTSRPPKSEAVLIEEYFIKATTGTTGFMSSPQREICKKLAEEGMTLERCKPGINQTIAEMNAKTKAVGSIQLCLPAIYQLDPAKVKPVVLNFPHPGQPRPKTQAELDNEADIERWRKQRHAQMARWNEVSRQESQAQSC